MKVAQFYCPAKVNELYNSILANWSRVKCQIEEARQRSRRLSGMGESGSCGRGSKGSERSKGSRGLSSREGSRERSRGGSKERS